jgi:general secretion pathway protein A
MSREHENAYTHLEYAISENKGFVVVTGEIGSGKTTLINYFLQKIQQDFQIGLINNTYIPSEQLLKVICQEFELTVNGLDTAAIRGIFHQFLIEQFAINKRVILFIDEAQNLSVTCLEEIRMLSNLEAEKHHLMQIILVGQPELKQKLQRRNLEQFSQRISVYCHLMGLHNGEVAGYIRHRLKSGGAKDTEIFQEDAIQRITEYSRGIPRLINILCDTALVYGFADSKSAIDRKIIEDVIEARGLGECISVEETTPIGSEPPVSTGKRPEKVSEIPLLFAQ